MRYTAGSKKDEGPLFETITSCEIPGIVKKSWDIFTNTGIRAVSLFVSPPGCAKTHGVSVGSKLVAQDRGLEWIESTSPDESQLGFVESHFANQPEEIGAGMPWVDYENNVQRRAMAGVYPASGSGIWMMDEVLQKPWIQRLAAQIVQRGCLDDLYTLPEWLPVMASNGSKDKAGVVPMFTHFQNRVSEFHVLPTVSGFLENTRLDAKPELQVYMKWFGSSRLLTFDPRIKGPFGSPRSWDAVNSYLQQGIDPVEDFQMIQGLIGYDNAADFRATYKAVSQLPNIEGWLADPTGYATEISATQNNNPNVICAFVYVMLRRLQETRDISDVARAIPVLEEAHMENVGAFIAVAKDIDRKAGDNITITDSSEYARHIARNPQVTLN